MANSNKVLEDRCRKLRENLYDKNLENKRLRTKTKQLEIELKKYKGEFKEFLEETISSLRKKENQKK